MGDGIGGVGPVGRRRRRSQRKDAHPHPHAPSQVEARALAAASLERRRIGRDLHDGIQQRLSVLVVRLSQLASLIESDPAQAVRLAGRVETEAQEAVGELREVIKGSSLQC